LHAVTTPKTSGSE